jgi:hypothetical protein
MNKSHHPREQSNNTYHMNGGINRRKYILETITKYQFGDSSLVGLPVNNKWQWSTKDPDIKRLLKKGLVKMIRQATPYGRNQNTGLKPGGKGQSYLILNK